MKLKHIITGFAALAFATTPVLAQVNSSKTSSAEISRNVEKSKSKSDLEGSTGLIIAAIGAAAAIAAIIVIVDDDDNDDTPASP